MLHLHFYHLLFVMFRSGLPNIGSTCYVNAAFQLICSTSNFVRALEEWYETRKHEYVESLNLILAFLACMCHIGGTKKKSYMKGTKEYDIKRFMSIIANYNKMYKDVSVQQSSIEFIEFLFDYIREEIMLIEFLRTEKKDISADIVHAKKKEISNLVATSVEKLPTPVDDHFQSTVQSQYSCFYCDKKNHSIESWFSFGFCRQSFGSINTNDIIQNSCHQPHGELTKRHCSSCNNSEFRRTVKVLH